MGAIPGGWGEQGLASEQSHEWSHVDVCGRLCCPWERLSQGPEERMFSVCTWKSLKASVAGKQCLRKKETGGKGLGSL